MGRALPGQAKEILNHESFVAGALSNRLEVWERLTRDRFVLECVHGVRLRFATTPVQTCLPPVYRPQLPITMEHVFAAVDQMLALNVIRPCSATPGQLLSPFFLLPKPDGDTRFVLNLKRLNEHLLTDSFKMEDGRTAANLLTAGDFMIKVDLEKAHYYVPPHASSTKFFRF